MIIKVNQNGISIDVSMSQDLIDKFGTTNATIPRDFIAKFKIKLATNNSPDLVQVIDKDEDEYSIHFSLITSINGESGFTSNIDVFNKINEALFGFTI